MSFFFKKLVSYFILPPGIFVIVLLIFYFFSKQKFLKRLALLSATTLYLISVEPFKDLLYYPLEKPYTIPENPQGDAIVVLGGGSYNDGKLKASSFKRLIVGFVLHKRTNLPIILSGGSSVSAIPEAEIMKDLLKAFGVEEKYIYSEVSSRDTEENAKYVKKVCKKIGCKRIILVTSGFHMKRAETLFKRAGFEVVPYPTDLKYEGKYNIYSFFPKYSVFYDSSVAIREYLGLFFYKLTGRI